MTPTVQTVNNILFELDETHQLYHNIKIMQELHRVTNQFKFSNLLKIVNEFKLCKDEGPLLK